MLFPRLLSAQTLCSCGEGDGRNQSFGVCPHSSPSSPTPQAGGAWCPDVGSGGPTPRTQLILLLQQPPPRGRSARLCSHRVSPSPPQVVANAVAALSEIAESHPSSNLLDLNPQSINKLLTALNECTEWGQIFILDCLANYMPKDDREAQR